MTFLLAAGAAPAFFSEVVVLIVAGAVIAYLCQRFGLVPIVGFLVAGVVIGPNGLKLVEDPALVNAAAEVGVILLLFTIGIEFSLEKLARIQRLIFGGGGLQVGLAVLATMGVLLAFGVPWQAGLFTGFLVALSSTAIVLKLLGDRGEMNAPQGQVGLGLLIFQDLAIIVMALLVPMLGGAGGSLPDIGWALAKALGIIVAVLVVARRYMPILLEAVARTCSPELFLLTVIALCFGTAFLTSLAGVSLSLGAFLAGLVVSESRFSEHAMGEILPLQILFSATFFVSVGMLLDVSFLLENLLLVLGVIAAVLVLKVVTTGVSVKVLGYPLPVAVASGFMLAQVGEFSFVLERVGREVALYPAGLAVAGSQAFIAATVVLMVLTPLLNQLGALAARRLAGRQKAVMANALEEEQEGPHEDVPYRENHVVVAGYGEAARRLVRVLDGSGIPFLITTLSPGGANEAEAAGLPVLRGDATRQRTLQLVGVDRAKMLVIADDDPATARRITTVGRSLNPTMRILVRTRYGAEVMPLAAAVADHVITEELESIIQLFAEVLRTYRIAPEEIDAHEAALRRGAYAAFQGAEGQGAPAVVCRLGDDCFDTREVIIREGAPAAGQSLEALGLDAYGLTPRQLRRNGTVMQAPAGDVVVQAGDALVLAGSAEAFARGADLFRPWSPDLPGQEDDAASSRTFVDTEHLIELRAGEGAAGCSHLDQVRPVFPSARGCEECLQIGATWVHLRVCMTCGHVGCCDSSQHKHASAHYRATDHPIIRSLEPGEDWGWCYKDKVTL